MEPALLMGVDQQGLLGHQGPDVSDDQGTPKRHRKEFSLREKREICIYRLQHPKTKIREVIAWASKNFGKEMGRSTMCELLKSSHRWINTPLSDSRSRMRHGKYIELENMLSTWWTEVTAHGLQPRDCEILEKAREIGDGLNVNNLSYSKGWLHRFKERHAIPTTKKKQNVKLEKYIEEAMINAAELSRENGDYQTNAQHLEEVCEGLWSLRNERIMCDMIIKVGEDIIKAHRAVLSSASPYLKTCCMYPQAFSDEGLVTIAVDRYSFKVCLRMLEYIYTGRLFALPQVLYEEFIKLSNEWQVHLPISYLSSQPEGDESFYDEEDTDKMGAQSTQYSQGEGNVGGVSSKLGNTRSVGQEMGDKGEGMKWFPAGSAGPPAFASYASGADDVKSEADHDQMDDVDDDDVDSLEDLEEVNKISASNPQGDGTSVMSGSSKTNKKDASSSKSTPKQDLQSQDLKGSQTKDAAQDSATDEYMSDAETPAVQSSAKSSSTPGTSSSSGIKVKNPPKTRASKGGLKGAKGKARKKRKTMNAAAELALRRKLPSLMDKYKMPHWCEECKVGFTAKNLLHGHNYENHWKEGMDMPKIYCCPEANCNYKTYNRKSWFGHKAFVHPAEPSICSLCQKVLKSSASLKQHMRFVHPDKPKRDYQCQSCPRTFKSTSGLQRHHENTHMERQKHICPHCGLTRLNDSSIRDHMFKIHDILPPGKVGLKCKFCDYKCLKIVELNNHEARHYDEKNFQCDQCEKRYSTKRELNKHYTFHTKTYKVFKCSYCDYSSKYSRTALEDHILAKHKDDRPCVCTICGYSCKLRGNLHKHIRNVHKCEVPTRQWTLPKYLSRPGDPMDGTPQPSQPSTSVTNTSTPNSSSKDIVPNPPTTQTSDTYAQKTIERAFVTPGDPRPNFGSDKDTFGLLAEAHPSPSVNYSLPLSERAKDVTDPRSLMNNPYLFGARYGDMFNIGNDGRPTTGSIHAYMGQAATSDLNFGMEMD